MKIKDIKIALNTVSEEYERTKTLPNATYSHVAAEVYWNSLPRIQYSELPDSLKRKVRDRFTADTIRQFLIECYPDHEEQQGNGTTASGYTTITSGIPENDLQKLFIKTRNTAIYTIESEEMEPTLYGIHACDAFESVIEEYRNSAPENHRKSKLHTIARAEKAGQIVSAGFYQRHISDKEYMHAMTAKPNENAYITIVNPGAFDKLEINSNGIVTYDKQFAGILKQEKRGQYTDIANIDFPLLVQFYTAAFNAAQKSDANTVTVYMPAFFKEMGIETGKGNSPDILKKINSFRDLWGIMEKEGTAAKVFSLIKIDSKSQTLTFAVPYIMHLFDTLGLKNKIERKGKQGQLICYDKPFHNQLIHSKIASERNKVAVELVTVLTNRMLQRGYIPDINTYSKKNVQNLNPDEITYHDKFRNIINDCPLLLGRIQSYRNNREKNKAIRRAFEKAYTLIHTKTDAEKYFCNLQINTTIPTMDTLDCEWTFSHTGRNGKYKQI